MSRSKGSKVSPKRSTKGLQVPRASGSRSIPGQNSRAKVAKMAQGKQVEVIDELARLAVELHRDALKELERY